MKSNKSITLVSILLICQTLYVSTKIINQNVERSLDLSSQVVKETIKIVTEEDTGNSFSEYLFIIPDDIVQNVAYMSAKDVSRKVLPLKESDVVQGKITITFHDRSPSHVFYVEIVYTNQIKPYPVEIKQFEKQFVKYTGYLYFYSAYPTLLQKTQVKLASSNIISYTQTKPYAVSSNKIKYGSYEHISSHSKEYFTVHYENSSPFMTVDRLERVIEVSHWGNIAVEESISLIHTGAKLKGSFSRYDFQKDTRLGGPVVKSYKTILPSSAFGIYYRDMNGNISTSNMNIMKDMIELELRPRFPLFGGWRTQYILGYNLPSFEYLFNDNEHYLLKMRAVDHIYDDMVIKEAVVKIILPETSTDIRLQVPYAVKRENDTVSYTYLDTIGRPTIIFSKNNVVEHHISDFKLEYKFMKIALLQEPLLITGFVFIIFLCTIVFKRLDFTISVHHHKE